MYSWYVFVRPTDTLINDWGRYRPKETAPDVVDEVKGMKVPTLTPTKLCPSAVLCAKEVDALRHTAAIAVIILILSILFRGIRFGGKINNLFGKKTIFPFLLVIFYFVFHIFATMKKGEKDNYKQPWSLSTSTFTSTLLQKKIISALVYNEREAIDVALFGSDGIIDRAYSKEIVIDASIIKDRNDTPVIEKHPDCIRGALKSLLDVKMEYWDEITQHYKGVNIIHEAEYSNNKIRFVIRSSIWDELCAAYKNRYSQQNIGHVMKFTSIYTARLYDILPSKPERYSVERLRDIFGCRDSYKAFSFFKSHVLEVAQKELINVTGNGVVYEFEKDGNKVTHVWIKPVQSYNEPDVTLFKHVGSKMAFGNDILSILNEIGWKESDIEHYFALLCSVKCVCTDMSTLLKNILDKIQRKNIERPFEYSLKALEKSLSDYGVVFSE